MGLFEQARNITDTDLRVVLTQSDQPVDALKAHILKLEASQRELVRSEEFLVRQRDWLEQAVERSLGVAEQSAARAEKMVAAGREDLAREALLDKKESMRQMSADARQLERLERSLAEARGQRAQLEARINQARRIRARIAAGEPLEEGDLHQEPPPPEKPVGLSPRASLTPGEEKELTRELDELRRQVKHGAGPEDKR